MLRTLRIVVSILLAGIAITGHAATWTKLGGYTYTDVLTGSSFDYNVKARALAAGWNGTAVLNANITVETTGVLYASGPTTYPFDTGTGFPAGSTITLINKGKIIGRGGRGGLGVANQLHCGWLSLGTNGENGGPALLARHAITINNTGVIAGGGGGGGGGGAASQNHYYQQYYGSGGSSGGGGAGIPAGDGGPTGPGCAYLAGGIAGTAGTETTGGAGGPYNPWIVTGGAGAAGGALGQAGQTGLSGTYSPAGYGGGYDFVTAGTAGGAPGYSVVGHSFVTWAVTGTVLGPTLF